MEENSLHTFSLIETEQKLETNCLKLLRKHFKNKNVIALLLVLIFISLLIIIKAIFANTHAHSHYHSKILLMAQTFPGKVETSTAPTLSIFVAEKYNRSGITTNSDASESSTFFATTETLTTFATPIRALPTTMIRPKACNNHYHTCEDVKCSGHTLSGIYKIMAWRGLNVYCDLETDGGGWTVMQRRTVSLGQPEDFYRNWNDYVSGFGNLSESFWLGLNTISELSADSNMELRIDLEDWAGERRFAHYMNFSVAGANESYKLIIGNYSGNAGDSLNYHNNCKFTTKDRDNDNYKDNNCANVHTGAWWYNSCYSSNLNGKFNDTSTNGITWHYWHGNGYSMKGAEMKIRIRNFKCE